MSQQWKALVLSMLAFQVVFCFVVMDLLDYAIWIHSSASDVVSSGLDTAPGRRAVTIPVTAAEAAFF